MTLYPWEASTVSDVRDRVRRMNSGQRDGSLEALDYAKFSGAMLALIPQLLSTIERLSNDA